MSIKKAMYIIFMFIFTIFCCSCALFNKPPELVFEYEEYDDAAVDPNEEGKTGRIAVLYGDWIYYLNNSERLYRIRTDGTGNARLSNDRLSGSFSVTQNWIYYENHYDRNSIYKMRPNGTERERIYEEPVLNIHAAGDWVYYTQSGYTNINKIRTDGTGHPIMVAWDIDRGTKKITLADGWIYHYRDNKYYKLRTDGTEVTKLNDDFIFSVDIADGWIYYINNNDGDTIYKMRTDGTEQTKLNNEPSNVISVSGDWLYYGKVTAFDDNSHPSDGHLYKMKIDGTDRTLVSEIFCTIIEIAGDWIYCEVNGGYQKMRLDGTDAEVLNY